MTMWADVPVLEGPLSRLSPEELAAVRDPRLSLPLFAQIKDQHTAEFVPYNPMGATFQLQAFLLEWIANPPRTPDGYTYWLNVLGSRQSGKTLTAELAFLCRALSVPGYRHLTIADDKDRAKTIFQYIHETETRWPREVKAERLKGTGHEINQLSFARKQGGRMAIMPAGDAAGGIGQSLSSVHGSEWAFAPDMNTTLSLLHPALINVRDAVVINECTPAAEGSEAPSAEQWRLHWEAGLPSGSADTTADDFDSENVFGRYRSVFFSVMDSVLCRRRWPEKLRMTDDEIRKLDRYGSRGLTKEHLAFFREVMQTDSAIRQNPQLLHVYYPLDAVTCWPTLSGGVFTGYHLDVLNSQLLTPWRAPFMEYETPKPGVRYLVTVDPTGEAARDHGSIVVQTTYVEEIATAAMYADHTPPQELARIACDLSDKYNGAAIAVDSTGAGQGFIAYVIARGYADRLLCQYPERTGPTGMPVYGYAASGRYNMEAVALFKDEILAGRFRARDEDLVRQIARYRNDKVLEQTMRAEQLALLRRTKSRTRTERHHWDKVSASMLGIYVVRNSLSPVHLSSESMEHIKSDFYTEMEALLGNPGANRPAMFVPPFPNIAEQ